MQFSAKKSSKKESKSNQNWKGGSAPKKAYQHSWSADRHFPNANWPKCSARPGALLNKIRYELERVLISKISKKIGFILIRRFLGQAMHLGISALAMCRLALLECRLALLGAKPRFQFCSIWTPFLRIFELGIAPRRVFNSYSKN